jgi:hypothetical protein
MAQGHIFLSVIRALLGANPSARVTGGEVQRIRDFFGYCTMAIFFSRSDSAI